MVIFRILVNVLKSGELGGSSSGTASLASVLSFGPLPIDDRGIRVLVSVEGGEPGRVIFLFCLASGFRTSQFGVSKIYVGCKRKDPISTEEAT